MADWRQIQARIRKAKSSSDPPAQLAELYQRTRDAMVAFELAQFHEKAGDGAAAAQWYTSAAQRFRRAQWRTKAEEALTRLGAPVPAPAPEGDAQADASETEAGQSSAEVEEAGTSEVAVVPSEQKADSEISSEPGTGQPAISAAPASPEGQLQNKKRRRGRRGGRGRRGKTGPAGAGAARPVTVSSAPPSRHQSAPPAVQPISPAFSRPLPEDPEPGVGEGQSVEGSLQPAATASWQTRTRAGDPALASRISHLESQLRRLLACPQASLDLADQAPAGPGVLILSDSDQVTHYYVEACQTLRIGIGNLTRTGRGDGTRLKERMAENLGIADSRVTKYLKDHCAVRWLQLDEGAKELAHFAISVLRPAVNE
jgi:hypothetical protein